MDIDVFCFEFRLATMKWFTAQIHVEDGCTSSECLKGSQPDMFYLIQSALNFTFIVDDDPIAGGQLENGSWVGQIGSYQTIMLNVQ